VLVYGGVESLIEDSIKISNLNKKGSLPQYSDAGLPIILKICTQVIYSFVDLFFECNLK